MTDVTLTEVEVINGTLAFSKGDKGDKGDNGDKGDAYVITDADKQEIKESLSGDIRELKGDIAEISKYSLTVDSEGYMCLAYKGE